MVCVSALCVAQPQVRFDQPGAPLGEEDEVNSTPASAAKALFNLPLAEDAANSATEDVPPVQEADVGQELDTVAVVAHASDDEPYESFDIPPASSANQAAADSPVLQGDSWDETVPESVPDQLAHPSHEINTAAGDQTGAADLGWEEGSGDWQDDLDDLSEQHMQQPLQHQAAEDGHQPQPAESQGYVTPIATAEVEDGLPAHTPAAKDSHADTAGISILNSDTAGSSAAEVADGHEEEEEQEKAQGEENGWDDEGGWDDMDSPEKPPSDVALPQPAAELLAMHEDQLLQDDALVRALSASMVSYRFICRKLRYTGFAYSHAAATPRSVVAGWSCAH